MTPNEDATRLLRDLPSVDRVLSLLDDGPAAAQAVREVLDGLRDEIRSGGLTGAAPDHQAVATRVRALLARRAGAHYPRVVNGTGVLLHTGLGRAPLPTAARVALDAVADGYCVLEVDPASNERKHRESRLTEDLCALTGAEAGTVVNNNAAALLLLLRTLAEGREVIVSRGELIEIGGGFRLPDLMAMSGARLVEVGTTNRTYARDYEAAITPDTALLLAVHTSNYRVVGFHHAPGRDELVDVARRHGIPFAEDIGSGLLAPVETGVLAHEPAARAALEAGVDLICFSGDKLLGGPQAGLLVGKADLVARCRRDPMFRALRPDRLTLVALAATLRLHREAPDGVPVLSALSAAPRARLEQARALAAQLAGAFPGSSFDAVLNDGRVGSGSTPGREVPSAAVEIVWPGLDAELLAEHLRLGTPSVFGRVWKARYRVDVLGLRPGDGERLQAALAALPSGPPSSGASS